MVPPDSVLSIDLELVSFKPVIDVTGNLGVLKKILKEGEGAHTANEGAAVSSKCLALLPQYHVFHFYWDCNDMSHNKCELLKNYLAAI